jgi:cytochrome b561
MYSETENILNDKKQAKFKQRATAIRRVSMVLLAFGMVLIGLAGAFWRTKGSFAMNSQTMSSIENSNFKNNWLSITVLTLGFLLMLLAVVGVMTSRKLLGAGSDEVKASRHQITNGYILMIIYLMLTSFMLITMVSAAWLFTVFNGSPSKWMESVYFTKRPGQTT